MDQAVPPFVVVLSQMAPSVPRTKTSITPLVGEVAAGDDVSFPPRFCQPDHDEPVYDLCLQSAVGALHKEVKAVCILRAHGRAGA